MPLGTVPCWVTNNSTCFVGASNVTVTLTVSGSGKIANAFLAVSHACIVPLTVEEDVPISLGSMTATTRSISFKVRSPVVIATF